MIKISPPWEAVPRPLSLRAGTLLRTPLGGWGDARRVRALGLEWAQRPPFLYRLTSHPLLASAARSFRFLGLVPPLCFKADHRQVAAPQGLPSAPL